MISNFPHLLDKPFSIEIAPSSIWGTLISIPSDTMIIRIIDKTLNEKQKHHFYYGSQDSIDAEFKGKYMDILLWEKNITANKITLSILFKLISHDMFVELFAFSASNKLERRKILKDLNLAKNLLRERIDLFYPAKLNLSIISLNNNNNNINNTNLIFPGDKVVATCRAYDGFPINKPIFTIPDQLNVTETVYDEDQFELKIYFFVLINNHLQKLICKAENTSESITIYILHHPTSIFIEPEIDKLVEPNTRLKCFVKDGYPAPEITWQLITGPRNASMYYSIISNGSQLDIKSNSPIRSNWAFKCSVKGYSMITERIISFSIAVHPSQLYVEPEIKKWLQSNSTISCYIKDENLNPEIKWQLVEGPPNASLYYDILNNGSEIYMNTNNLPGTIWTFRCYVKIVLTTTKAMNKTISFVIAKNFMEKCDEKCINRKLLELEESIERNKKLHQDIYQIKLLINQSSLEFKKFDRNIVNWQTNMANELNKFNETMKTLKYESNGNALKIERNNKLQHDIIDQLKISINKSSTDFQRFHENNENWRINIKSNLNNLINQSSSNFQKLNRNIENLKINMENELDKFNLTLKYESNGNVLTIEKNNKLQHDIIDQLKSSFSESSADFQRFNENNENWKLNIKSDLNKLSKTMEALKNELNTKRINENSKPILLSFNKPTKQSSTFDSLISAYAVDGDYSLNLNKDRRCTHTDNDFGAFWMVDLEGYYKIDHVVIYNRDDCCQERLVGAIIEILSKYDRVIDECGTISQSKKVYVFKCFSIPGQKIRIRFNKSEYLSLCEVEVFGLL